MQEIPIILPAMCYLTPSCWGCYSGLSAPRDEEVFFLRSQASGRGWYYRNYPSGLSEIYWYYTDLMPSNCGARGDSWEFPGQQGDQSSQSEGKSSLNTHWKDWCWSRSSSVLVICCEQPAHWKSPWCGERLRAEGEECVRGWDGWMASPMQWTWTWADFGRWWETRRPGILQSMGSQRVAHDWATEHQQQYRRKDLIASGGKEVQLPWWPGQRKAQPSTAQHVWKHKGLSEGRTGAGIGDVRILTPILTSLPANQVNQTHDLTLTSTTAMPNRNNSSHICNFTSLSGLSCFSRVWLFTTLWTVGCQAPLSMGFPKQEYWNGLPFPSPKDLSEPGIEPMSRTYPTPAGGFFTTSATWEANLI